MSAQCGKINMKVGCLYQVCLQMKEKRKSSPLHDDLVIEPSHYSNHIILTNNYIIHARFLYLHPFLLVSRPYYLLLNSSYY